MAKKIFFFSNSSKQLGASLWRYFKELTCNVGKSKIEGY
jgi:phosphatidate phosphatase APP1